ncbi:MFS transporter [Paraburkholderia unamae]|uniref:MFS family arabinose efflux permease n=1 Tax=Paraburkholderia unamae TaxID=219649 RepID=A0ABX5KNN6_9BURK|nr:MFS transporter [Paraburkholderia unamae]PVX82648.1 putative MFS family arabinose efflux permease [Paraburkholderia unamae]CAG9267519.1 MFS transporter [Paraburkholderia unamae]
MNTSTLELHPARAGARTWWALAVLLMGTLLPPLDFFIVNVALPSMQAGLHANAAVAQLVISAYAATYAIFLITGGRLGDLYGRRRIFLVGIVAFAAASAVCGFATSPAALVTGRILQGGAAAVMAPQALASIHALFPSHQKGLALSLFGAAYGIASVAGQALGGVLVSANVLGLGWRSIFLINLPVVIVAAPAAFWLVRESRSDHPAKLDLGGMALLAVALTALVVPLIEGRERGWPLWTWALLACAAPLFALFWRYEARVASAGRDALVPPALFGAPGLVRGLVATLFFYSLAPFFMMFAIYVQRTLGLAPLEVGLGILPLGVGFLVGPLVNPLLVRRFGARTAAAAMMVEGCGLIWTAMLVHDAQSHALTAPLFLIGFGQGVALPALVRRNVECVDRRWSGLAAGLVSSVLQVSAALAVALIGGLFFALAGPDASGAQVARAFATAVAIIGILLFIAALLADARNNHASELRKQH